MNKTAIKNYAVWARVALIEAVKQRAYQYGITEKNSGDTSADSVNGFVLTPSEKQQRQALIGKIREKGYEQVCEEAAYTWFNRFAALRFMEVNGYLPSRVRVFTDEQNAFKPQILAEAMHLELDGLDLDRVIALTEKNKTDELYKYLLITQCNALNAVLPSMFQKIDDYTELLFPDNLLREGSVIERMIAMIPEDDWTDQVQIIGWLYQYYNTEPKDKVFADLKKNIKISKDKIPAATQLFTPDWIVRYMVENSLGRLWVEGHPNDEMKAAWKYYLEEAEQEPEVQVQLAEIRKGNAELKPTDIKVIDPCCGSGHILCYLFDVLMQIYEASGYAARDAAQSILLYNLWGLDIDERAAQLSYFAVMMKARQYDRRFFSRNIQPHVLAIAESNGIENEAMDYYCKGDSGLIEAMRTIISELHDAKEYGSILTCSRQNWDQLHTRFSEIYDDISMHRDEAIALLPLVQTAEALSQQYHVVVTNPPYMGGSGMSGKLNEFVKKHYPNSKSDLFSVFIERGFSLSKHKGYTSMITMESWMFLSSFEKMRKNLLSTKTIMTLVHMPYLGKGGTSLGINFGTDMAIIKNQHISSYIGTYDRIAYYETDDEGVPFEFPVKNEYYKHTSQENYSKIPGFPVAYWVSENFVRAFSGKSMKDYSNPCIGMRTGDNDRFLRMWYEVDLPKIGFGLASSAEMGSVAAKWIPYHKGGEYRKWYGNNDYIVNWENNGFEIKENTRRVYPQLGDNLGWKISNESYYFQDGITWTSLSSGDTSFRRYSKGFIFSNSGQAVVGCSSEMKDYLIAILNSRFAKEVLDIITPTMGFESGYIAKIPVVIAPPSQKEEMIALARENINLAKADWDSFEVSWDYVSHPLINRYSTIDLAFTAWKKQCDDRFYLVKRNEERINALVSDIFGLGTGFETAVSESQVTIRKANLSREIKSLLSYAAGCMFGRYSLDKPGVIYAGGNWDTSQYVRFEPDKDGIIPICDDEYFEDDIVGRFVKFIEVAYGRETLEQNLKYIANALGGKGTPRQVIRNYFLNDFYPDHLKVYQKRPIYWLFDSGKKNGFKCLIYMHRYQPDTLARIRTDYVHELQSRYRTAVEDLNDRAESAAPAERVKLSKQLQKLQAQEDELRIYEEKIHHLADQMIAIDLDDGVKVNYAIFEDVLAKIK